MGGNDFQRTRDVSHPQDFFKDSGNIPDPRDMEIKLKEVLSRELKHRGESVHAVAEATGIPSSTLHSWVAAGQLPSAKNLHHLKKLSEYLNISISVLLFNAKEDNSGATILFQTTFVDQDTKYRLVIEKMKT